MKKTKLNISVVITALICITLLEIVALCFGFDGVLLTVVIALIAGAAGFVVPSEKLLKFK